MTKRHKGDYGAYIINNKEALLKKKKKAIRLKRTMLIFMVLLTIFITLGFTLPVFNLTEVRVTGNEFVSREGILASAEIQPDINVFKINTSKVEKILKENIYIKNVKVKRQLPNKLSIKLEERKIAFSVMGAEGNYAVDETGIVLGVREDITSKEVIPLEGIPAENLVPGKEIHGEQDGNIDGAIIIHEFLSANGYFEVFPNMKIQVRDFVDYKLYVGEAYINLGTKENMGEKLGKAFSVLSTPQFMGMKGYIDVSFKGNPVVKKEN